MGYYTYYDLKPIQDPDDQFDDFMKELGKKSGYWEDEKGPYDCIKWYNWETDCEKVSKHYPNLIVEITGDGEESTDFWYARVCNGFLEYHDAIIIYPPFQYENVLTDEEKKDEKRKSLLDMIMKEVKYRLNNDKV